MYNDYIPVIVFAALAIGLLIAPLVIQHLVSPRHNKKNDKLMSYECGEVPEGSAWVKFNIRFYIIALVFILITQIYSPLQQYGDEVKSFNTLFF